MNKPPEKIRFVFDPSDGFLCQTDATAEVFNDTSIEIFYTLEKPMTQKTENLTTQEAWAAMARGECVKSKKQIQTLVAIDGFSELRYYSHSTKGWFSTALFEVGPYSIVPDPSKPKEVEDEYEKDRLRIISTVSNEDNLPEYQARKLIEFIERNFEKRKS